MKTHMVLILFLLISRLGLSQNMVGNGGDIVASEFNMIARTSLYFLKAKPLSLTDQKLLLEIEKKIETTFVESVAEELSLDGHPVDAINYPRINKIKVSRKRWELIRLRNPAERAMIVLHEYIWVAGINDATYSVSTRLTKEISYELNQNSISTRGYWVTLNEFYVALELYRTDILKMQSRGKADYSSYCLNVGALQVHIQRVIQLTQQNKFWFSAYQTPIVDEDIKYLNLFSENQLKNCRQSAQLNLHEQIESLLNIKNIIYFLMRLTKFPESQFQ